MSVGDLARYLKVSRQNLSGLLSRMERDGRCPDRARRARPPIATRVTMTESGRQYGKTTPCRRSTATTTQVLDDFSVNDITHTLHYLLKILENMQRLDAERLTAEDGEEAKG